MVRTSCPDSSRGWPRSAATSAAVTRRNSTRADMPWSGAVRSCESSCVEDRPEVNFRTTAIKSVQVRADRVGAHRLRGARSNRRPPRARGRRTSSARRCAPGRCRRANGAAISACSSASSSGRRADPGLAHHQDLRVDHVQQQGRGAADETGPARGRGRRPTARRPPARRARPRNGGPAAGRRPRPAGRSPARPRSPRSSRCGRTGRALRSALPADRQMADVSRRRARPLVDGAAGGDGRVHDVADEEVHEAGARPAAFVVRSAARRGRAPARGSPPAPAAPAARSSTRADVHVVPAEPLVPHDHTRAGVHPAPGGHPHPERAPALGVLGQESGHAVARPASTSAAVRPAGAAPVPRRAHGRGDPSGRAWRAAPRRGCRRRRGAGCRRPRARAACRRGSGWPRSGRSRTRPRSASSAIWRLTAAALSPVTCPTVLRATGPRSRIARSTAAAFAARLPSSVAVVCWPVVRRAGIGRPCRRRYGAAVARPTRDGESAARDGHGTPGDGQPVELAEPAGAGQHSALACRRRSTWRRARSEAAWGGVEGIPAIVAEAPPAGTASNGHSRCRTCARPTDRGTRPASLRSGSVRAWTRCRPPAPAFGRPTTTTQDFPP